MHSVSLQVGNRSALSLYKLMSRRWAIGWISYCAFCRNGLPTNARIWDEACAVAVHAIQEGRLARCQEEACGFIGPFALRDACACADTCGHAVGSHAEELTVLDKADPGVRCHLQTAAIILSCCVICLTSTHTASSGIWAMQPHDSVCHWNCNGLQTHVPISLPLTAMAITMQVECCRANPP